MATVDKDFKVKNGLVVTNGGSFGGAVTVGTPALADHAVTKSYVDALVGNTPVGSTAPESPENGDMWFDTLTERLNVYYGGSWLTIATIDDTLTLTDHIHDTSIDGTGLIITVFQDAGFYDAIPSATLDGGFYNTTVWDQTFDGGNPTDNFN